MMQWYHTLLMFIAAAASLYAAGVSYDIYIKLHRLQDDLQDVKKEVAKAK